MEIVANALVVLVVAIHVWTPSCVSNSHQGARP